MYLFVKFVHIIAAMVFFGLPIVFGRWFGTAWNEGAAPAIDRMLRQMKRYLFFHLNLCGILLLFTGWWMASSLKLPLNEGWLLLGLAGFLVSLVNLNLLAAALQAHTRDQGAVDLPSLRSLRRRLIGFSALHHTLVTAVTALMVFRPAWP